MRERHVVVITTSYPERPADPAGHFVAAEVNELVDSGARVSVLTPRPSQLRRVGVRVIAVGGATAFGWPGALERLRKNPLRVLQAARFCIEARRHLATLRPDEIVAHWLVPSLLIALPLDPSASRAGQANGQRPRARVTGVAHGSDVALLQRLPRPVLRRVIAGWLARGVALRFVSERLQTDLAIACGDALGDKLRQHSEVRPSPIDTSGVPSRAEARSLLGIGDAFLALCVGRLVPGKRVDWALSAAPVPEAARWVVIGDGPELEPLRRAHPKATFTGALSRQETLTWISAADVLISSSEREGAPTVIREARQLGTLVWTSDVGDVRRWAELDPGIVVMRRLTPAKALPNCQQ